MTAVSRRLMFQVHVESLCSEHGIALDQRFNLPGMMFVEEQPSRIEIPTMEPCFHAPTVNLCYMVALHEIGHCVHGHTQGRPPFGDQTYYFDHGVLRCEAEAWNWALDAALGGSMPDEGTVQLTAYDCTYIAGRYIGSYIRAARLHPNEPYRLGNGNRHHVEFRFDDPDQPYVQDTLDRIRDAWKTHDVLLPV